MRRLSTAAPAARSRLAGLFAKQPAISDLAEMQTIASVQKLMAQIPADPAPRALAEGSEYRTWLANSRSSRGLTDTAASDTFAAFFQEAVAVLKAKEDEALRATPPVGVIRDEELALPDAEQFVEAAKLKLARHMCAQAGAVFELLDKDKDGKVQAAELDRLLRVVERGNTPEWLRSQFELLDADGDDAVTEAEAKQVLDALVGTQKAVVTELFATHVSNMPKKHMKVVAKGVAEEDWKSKIVEKERCVFHFAGAVEAGEEEEAQGSVKKQPEPKRVRWEAFLASQEAELPELHNLLAVYTKGVYDWRFEQHQRKREWRSTRNKGLALAAALAVGDYVATVL